MPPRKSNVSIVTNGTEEAPDSTPAKQLKDGKDGMSVEDLSLPKSMVARLAKGVLPANTQIQKDALLALHKSTTVFVSYLASNSNEIAQSAGKKTILPQDVVAALKDCELEGFIERLEKELTKYNEMQCDKRNTYRRKVKEDKAAAASKDVGDDSIEGETTEGANGEVSGHANGEEDLDRPAKKLKADDGTALPAVDGGFEAVMDDGSDGEQDDPDDMVDEAEDDVDEEDDAGEDEDEIAEEAGLADSRLTDLRDEALDDPASDSD